MNRRLLILLVLAPLFSCKSTPVNQVAIQVVNPETTIYQPKDKEILEQILELYSQEREAATSDLMLKVDRYLFCLGGSMHDVDAAFTADQNHHVHYSNAIYIACNPGNVSIH